MIELDKRGSAATYRRGGTKALAGYITYSNAIRIGDCPASDATSSSPHDDVMPLLFDLNEVFDSKGRPLECPRWWKPYIPVKCGI
ncbi:hypothetical protein FHT00_002687 [Sphingomonas insulae]|uniref:Uncharacterized protein n=1 Tax=Sphingomonas insulae TaxID=424800 RepID=A0ABN1HZW9_9SPHN|nr:hypothetical protein [Sphingomonas insulae]NIJ30716.1 hypothetical protein [Sphingomonas insulae]